MAPSAARGAPFTGIESFLLMTCCAVLPATDLAPGAGVFLRRLLLLPRRTAEAVKRTVMGRLPGEGLMSLLPSSIVA
jgi:hypothetical protein